MANKKLVEIIKKQGVIGWNEWREINPYVQIDLTEAKLEGVDLRGANFRGDYLNRVDLKGANFKGANLGVTNLRGVNLYRADFREANLYRADLKGADLRGVNLEGANLEGADLRGVNLEGAKLRGADLRGVKVVRAYLEEANLEGVNLEGVNLEGANLEGANLEGANLEGAKLRGAKLRGAKLRGAKLEGVNLRGIDLREAKLEGVNLRGANLSGFDFSGLDLSKVCLEGVNFSRVQALNTNFDSARFTGSCIQDWNINSQTNLTNVICDYIYLKNDQQERRPSDPNRNFEPGEFTKLFQKALETVDLIFLDGIDWPTFLTSFQNLQVEYDDQNLSIQAIEKKQDGAFVIRIDGLNKANKDKIEESFWNKYKPLLAAKDAEIKLLSEQNKFYSQEVKYIRESNTQLLGIVQTMSEKQDSKVTMTFQAPVTGVAGNVEGNQVINASEQKQTLAEAAKEIQALLDQLSQTYNSETKKERRTFTAEAINLIKDDPSLTKKLLSAVKAGSLAALESMLNHPAASFVIAALEDLEEN